MSNGKQPEETEDLFKLAYIHQKVIELWTNKRIAICGADYAEQADNEILKLAMIETKEALEKLDEILDTPNLDGIYIGPAGWSSFR